MAGEGTASIEAIINSVYSNQNGGDCWISIREFLDVLGSGGYRRLRESLARRGFRIERSRSFTWAIAEMPCDDARKAVAEAVNSLIEEKRGGGEAGCEPRGIDDVDNYLASRVLGLIPGLRDAVDDLVINLKAGNHVVLLGGPGSGKTLIIDAVAEAANNPLYVNMADASAAGIEDLILEAGCVDYLLLDEVDKARNVALSPLLQLLDHGGRLRVTKHGKTTGIELPRLRAVAAANPFNPRLKSSNWWGPLMDRLVPIEVPRPSIDDLMKFMESTASAKMPAWVKQLIEEYIDKVTLRKVEQAARYIATAMGRGRDEDAVRARVEKALRSYTGLAMKPSTGER